MAHVAYGYGLFTGGLGYHYGAERLGCALVPVSGGMTERQVQLINDFAPDILFATPSYALCLIDEFRAQCLRLPPVAWGDQRLLMVSGAKADAAAPPATGAEPQADVVADDEEEALA